MHFPPTGLQSVVFISKFMSIEFTHHSRMQVIQREPWEHIKDEDIKKAAASFCGEIWQVPPMFSAIKVRVVPYLVLSLQK